MQLERAPASAGAFFCLFKHRSDLQMQPTKCIRRRLELGYGHDL
jgi:hypothetical protein